MSEPKYAYRLPPCHSFDISAMETWLEDMAAKGYILSKDGFFMGFATFEKSRPQSVRYRLEATATPSGMFSSNYDPEDSLIQLYHQMGWTYQARRGQFFVFCTDDPNAPELNTDPVVQAHTIQALAKYQRSQLCSSIFSFLFLAWLHFSSWFFSGILVIGTFPALLLMGLFAWDFAQKIFTIIQLNKLKQQLKNGDPIEHSRDYVNRTFPYYAGKLTRGFLWILAFALFAYNVTAAKPHIPLEEYGGSFPFATLQDLYPEAEVTPWDSFTESEVTVWSDFLAPVCVEYTESSNVKLPGAPNDSMWLDVCYFETRWEWTAKALAKELIHQAGASPMHQFFDELFGDEPITVTDLDIPGADYAAYYYKYRGFPYVVIRTGTTVLKANIDVFGDDTAFTPEEFARAMLDSLD